jgi:hypothetical protein
LPCNTIEKNYELPLPEVFNGKIVINEMNSYSENFEMIDLGKGITASEEVGK